MKLSLRNKFLVPTLLIIIIGMAVSSMVGYVYSRDALKHALNDQIKQIVTSLDQVVTSWVHDREKNVETWSKQKIYISALEDTFFGKAARKTANDDMAFLKKSYPYYEDLLLVNANGDIVSSSDLAFIGKFNVKDRDYFQEAIKGKTFISEVVLSKGSGKGVFVIAAPVMEKDVQKGVLCGVVDLSYFGAFFVKDIKVGQSGYAYIFQTSDGLVVAHPNDKILLKLKMTDYDFGREIIKLGTGAITYTYDGVEKAVAFKKSNAMNWIIAAGVPTSELLAPAKRIGFINLFVGLAIVLLAALVVFMIARSIVKPVNRISRGLSEGATQVAYAAGQVRLPARPWPRAHRNRRRPWKKHPPRWRKWLP